MNVRASIGELIAALLEQRVLVEREGEKVRIVAPLGDPIPKQIVTELQERKDEVLAYLRWREAADDLLAACLQRLTDAYPIGARLDGPAWQRADAAVTAAYWTLDLDVLRAAVSHYEHFARDCFAACKRDFKETSR